MKINQLFILIVTITLVLLTACQDEEVDPPAASTVADFSYTVSNNAIAPATVTFTNQSVNTNYYEWDFGNGENSNAENPSVTYEEAGTYTVSLSVEAENDVYYNNLTQTSDIKIKGNPLKTLYYTDKFDNKIHYIVLDTVSPVVQDFPNISTTSANFMAIDTTNAAMYISDKGSGKITKAMLSDGSNEVVVDMANTAQGGSPWGITVVENQLYFVIENADGEGKIMQCNLDGSGLAVAANINDYLPLDLTYNPGDQKLYFSNDGYYDDGGVWRVNTDGTNLEVVVQNHNGSPVDAAGIAIDHVNGRLYYSHWVDQVIVMNTLDGNNPVEIGTYTNQKLLYGLKVDIDNQYLYWSDRPSDDGSGDGNIIRAAFTVNGEQVTFSAQEIWISGADVDLAPYGMAIDTYR